MFTGIIREIGKIRDITRASGGTRFIVSCQKILEGIEEGARVNVQARQTPACREGVAAFLRREGGE